VVLHLRDRPIRFLGRGLKDFQRLSGLLRGRLFRGSFGRGRTWAWRCMVSRRLVWSIVHVESVRLVRPMGLVLVVIGCDALVVLVG
jgi:hypothetical protein